VLSHVAWSFDGHGAAAPATIFAVEGYTKRLSRGSVTVLEVQPHGEAQCEVTLGPYTLAAVWDAATVRIMHEPSGQSCRLALPADHTVQQATLDLEPGLGVVLSTMRRPYDGALLLCASGLWQVRTSREDDLEAFQRETGPFVGEGLGFLYRKGLFGPRLAEGGDGSAERLLVDSIARAASYFERASLAALARQPDADLYISYQPCIDDIEHELLGWCDPRSRAYRPAIAAEAWAVLRRVYQLADHHLASVLRQVGPAATVIVSSDHGMAGMTDTVHINQALAADGLLAFDANGAPDLPRTRILYHPANNGSLWINTARRPGGIVSNDDEPTVVMQAVATLRSLTDPATGAPVIHAVYPEDGGEQSGWGPSLGDLFLAAADGYELSAAPSPTGRVITPTPKSASHATYPDRAALRGIFYSCGPGLRAGLDLGEIDNREVFPLVCRQLGISAAPYCEKPLRAEMVCDRPAD
jgi:hypothetical protein